MSKKHNLVLSRREGQKVLVNVGDEQMSILVKEIEPNGVSLLFTASDAVRIDRPERLKKMNGG